MSTANQGQKFDSEVSVRSADGFDLEQIGLAAIVCLERTIPVLWLKSRTPTSVSHLAGRLRSQYQVDQGVLRISGFSSTQSAVYVFLTKSPESDARYEVLQVVSDDGQLVNPSLTRIVSHCLPEVLAQWDGLATAADRAGVPPSLSRKNQPHRENRPCREHANDRELTNGIEQLLQSERSSGLDISRASLDLVVRLELEKVDGKLCFQIGEQSVESTFSNWGIVLLQQPNQSPSYTCPMSGDSGRHLVADREGDISVATQLAVCELSGHELHRFKLVCCANSGRWISRSLAIASATSADFFCPQHVSFCPQCSLAATRSQIQQGTCSACRQLRRIEQMGVAQQLEARWVLEQFIVTEANLAAHELRDVRYFSNGRFHWYCFERQSRMNMIVLDLAGQKIIHREKGRWQWRWREVASE